MSDCKKLGREFKLRVSVEKYELVGDAAYGDAGMLHQIKARVSLVQSGQHVEYILGVQAEGKSWRLRKRFAEFASLHDTLSRRLHNVPPMPAKSVMRGFEPAYLESRKNSLNAYVEQILRRRDVLNCSEIHQFFGLLEELPSFRQPHASEPIQAAEVHEAAFGITDFKYDPMQGLLLVGATDCSWTSRMDTKITNIKLPWEPAAPNLPTSQMSLWRQSPADLRFEMIFTCRYAASIGAVVLSASKEKGYCLCALGDGTVGCQSIKGEPGVNNMGTTLPLLRHTAGVVALAFDDNEQWVITASKDNAMIVYDIRRQMVQCEVQTPSPVTSMHYSQEQKRIFCGLQSGKVMVWDTSVMPIQQLTSIPDGADSSSILNSRICALDYDAVTSTLFTGTAQGFALWSIKSSSTGCWGRVVGQIKDLTIAPTALAWANSSREILAGFSNGAVIVFDVDCGEATYALQAHNDEVTSLLWLDAPRRLLTASKDKTMKIWDFPSLRRITHVEDMLIGISVAPSSSASASTGQSKSRGADKPKGFEGFASLGPDPLGGLGRAAAREKADSGEGERLGGGYTSSASPLGGLVDPSFSSEAGNGGKVRHANPFADPLSSNPLKPPELPAAAPGARAVKAAPKSMKKSDSDDDLMGWDK